MERQVKKIPLVITALLLLILVSGGLATARQATAQQAVPANVDSTASPITAASTVAADYSTAESLGQQLLEWAEKLANEKLRRELIDWITSEVLSFVGDGLDGAPKFVENWTSFLGEAANSAKRSVAGLFADANLCDSFKPQILQALGSVSVSGSTWSLGASVGCSTDAGEAAKFDKNFGEGGWDAYQQSLRPENNYILSLVRAETVQASVAERAERAAEAEGVAGGGFLSDSVDGFIKTPGSVIKDLTSRVAGIEIDYTLAADSLEEYVNAIANSLMGSILDKGLASVIGSLNSGGSGRSGGWGNVPPGGGAGRGINNARFGQEKKTFLRDIKQAISLREKGQAFYDNASGSVSLADGETALAALEYLRDEFYLINEDGDLNSSKYTDDAGNEQFVCSANFRIAKRLQNRVLPDIEDMIKDVESVMDALEDAAVDEAGRNQDLLRRMTDIQAAISDVANSPEGRQTLTELKAGLGGGIVVDARQFENNITGARKIFGRAYNMLTEDQNWAGRLDDCTKHRSPAGSYSGGTLPFSYSGDSWTTVPERPFPWE